MTVDVHLLTSDRWKDYELLDSGDGKKLERFGAYTFVRPEVQALWRAASPRQWDEASALFQATGEESGGHWQSRGKIPEKWEMRYALASTPASFRSPESNRDAGGLLRFWAQTTPGRHLGVFPEGAADWDWVAEKIQQARARAQSQPNVLNLFGYTGLATLAAACAGARVTHVDASKKAVGWARENQALSGLADKPVRWIVDDALKFVEREGRRGAKYDGLLLDPPKFGRGPKGEVWEVYRSLPLLLNSCRRILSDEALFVIVTVYAVKASAVHLYYALQEIMKGLGGSIECGELVTREKSAGRLLSSAVYARWERAS